MCNWSIYKIASNLCCRVIFLIVPFNFFTTFSFAQVDSLKFSSNKISVLIGTCETLNHSMDDGGPFPLVYFGPAVNLYYSKYTNKRFMFQTGLEYASTKYFLPYLELGHDKFSKAYINVKLNINSFAIPIYFNLLLLKQKLYIGAGPSFDMIYSIVNGDGGSFSSDRLVNNSSLLNKTIFSFGTKLGYNIDFGKIKINIEGKIKMGVTNLFPAWTENKLSNEHISLSTGIMF